MKLFILLALSIFGLSFSTNADTIVSSKSYRVENLCGKRGELSIGYELGYASHAVFKVRKTTYFLSNSPHSLMDMDLGVRYCVSGTVTKNKVVVSGDMYPVTELHLKIDSLQVM